MKPGQLDEQPVNTVHYLGKSFNWYGGYASGWKRDQHKPSVLLSSQPIMVETMYQPVRQGHQPLGWKRGSGTYHRDHSYQGDHKKGIGWSRGYFGLLG
ncbi:hypothetical protein HHI36_000967 [Cryptolaemus montrouzieri]|uniref:Uncharacterized protein n=1 Tax=Cryptolaemus montrouzieri TaxID=559131 RepID=A0ABD2P6N9_9CUCU